MRNYLKNYKVKNPRALKLGLMTTGLSLMQGAGQTYDRPVSTTGLVGAAGLQGLGTYEATLDSKMRRRLGEAQIKTAERDPLKTFMEKREITAPERALEKKSKEAQIIGAVQDRRANLLKTFTSESVEEFQKSQTPENKRGDMSVLKRVTGKIPFKDTERGALELANIKASATLGKRESLTLVQRQKQVDSSIDKQLANKLLNSQPIKDAIYNGTATAASVAKDPSAYLSPDGFKLYQKTKSLTSKYSKDMPIQEAIQKAETEAQTSTGDDLIRKFVTIKNPEERKAFAQNLKESDPDLYAIFLEASKRYDAEKEKKTMKDKNYPSSWTGGLIRMRRP